MSQPRKWPAGQKADRHTGPPQVAHTLLFHEAIWSHQCDGTMCIPCTPAHPPAGMHASRYTDARQQAAVPSHVEQETSHGQPVQDMTYTSWPRRGQKKLAHSRNLTRLGPSLPTAQTSSCPNCPLHDVTTYTCTYFILAPAGPSYPPRCRPFSPMVVARRFEPAACCDPACLVWVLALPSVALCHAPAGNRHRHPTTWRPKFRSALWTSRQGSYHSID